MAYFDRFDICEAHCVLEWDFNRDGMLWERPANQRRLESTGVQLARMDFAPGMDLSFEALSPNGQDIYLEAAARYGLLSTHLTVQLAGTEV